MKIDHRKHYILLIDTETTNDINESIAYDIGFIVADTKGNIYEEFSYMVSEMFFDYKDLLNSAFYAKKLPRYWEDYKNDKRIIASIYTIRKKIWFLMKLYHITDVYAYNCRFDKSTLNRTIRYLTKSKVRWFFPFGTKFYCIWNMACQVLCTRKSYKDMATLNNWLSASGNIQTSAETVKRYISNDLDFKEEHTGLEDVKIEYEILLKCLSTHKKMDKSINSLCWRIPNKKK